MLDKFLVYSLTPITTYLSGSTTGGTFSCIHRSKIRIDNNKFSCFLLIFESILTL